MGRADLAGATRFDAQWMFVAPPVLLAVYLYAAVRRPPERSLRLWTLTWVLPFVYSLHQFEEHGYDVYGRRYAFIAFLNGRTAAGLFSVRGITIINMVGVHVMYLAAAAWHWSTTDLLPVAGCWAITTFNALGPHIAVAASSREYNPGLAQAAVLGAPLGTLFFYTFSKVVRTQVGTVGAARALVAMALFGSVFAHGVGILAPALAAKKMRLVAWQADGLLLVALLVVSLGSYVLGPLLGVEVRDPTRPANEKKHVS